MEVLKAIESRRSIRKYKSEPILDEDLKKILEAARLAPSAGNKQPWGFVVVRDVERKKRLAEAARNQTWICDAGTIVVVFSDPSQSPGGYTRWVERDPMIPVEHMFLVAWSLGYGCCWIGAFEEDQVRALLGIPADKRVTCLLPIGVPNESPAARTRRPFQEVFHSEAYGTPLKL
jgi:nitroreductase